jgi:hypothetical protein
MAGGALQRLRHRFPPQRRPSGARFPRFGPEKQPETTFQTLDLAADPPVGLLQSTRTGSELLGVFKLPSKAHFFVFKPLKTS